MLAGLLLFACLTRREPPADSIDEGRGSDTAAEADPATVFPPLGGTSGGSGGTDGPESQDLSAGPVPYVLLAPSGSASGRSRSFLIIISGAQGATVLMSSVARVAPLHDLGDTIIAVLDGRTCTGGEGVVVLQAVRAAYDIDNDRTWLLSEPAGTAAGLDLAFHEAPSYFAAYWANDVTEQDEPEMSAAELGFVPSGNTCPGGNLPDAEAIVAAMADAGWNLPADAPYSGVGADTHASVGGFLAALDFFPATSR